MKKIPILLSLLLLTSCGNASSSDTKSSTPAFSEVESEQTQISEKQCVLYMDDNTFSKGVVLEDKELVGTAEDFCTAVKEKYSPVAEDPSEASKGDYIELLVIDSESIVPNNIDKSKCELDIYIASKNGSYVSINGETYNTTDGETAEFAAKLLEYRQ